MSTTIRRGHAGSPEAGAERGQVPERGPFARLGRTVTAHPVRVALGWVIIVAALTVISGALGQAPPSSAEAGQLPAGYESARAQAASSVLRTSRSSMRRSRHWRVRAESSISAMLSQEPCLGV